MSAVGREAAKVSVIIPAYNSADYTVETVVGADVVQSYGGEVLLARLEDGFSTTRLVERSAVGRSAVERSTVGR